MSNKLNNEKDLINSLINDEKLQKENNDLKEISETSGQDVSTEKNELLDKLEDEIKNNDTNKDEESLTDDEELSDEEKREKLINFLKQSRIRFKNTVHNGNVTHTKFDTNYKKKRKKHNKLAKKSRKANRK